MIPEPKMECVTIDNIFPIYYLSMVLQIRTFGMLVLPSLHDSVLFLIVVIAKWVHHVIDRINQHGIAAATRWALGRNKFPWRSLVNRDGKHKSCYRIVCQIFLF